VYAMDVWATIGNLAPKGEYEISFEWDDSLITDREKEFNQRMLLMQMGEMQKGELRAWYLGETLEQAQEQLAGAEELVE